MVWYNDCVLYVYTTHILKTAKRIIRRLTPDFVVRYFKPKRQEHIITPEERAKAMTWVLDEVHRPIPTESSIRRVEIIVLKFKDPEVETRVAQHVIENTEWPYKLTMYDNRPGVKNMSKIWNQLIRESTCDYVLIMDSDAFPPVHAAGEPCWLTRMMRTFQEFPDCGIVVPRVTTTSCDEQRATKSEHIPATLMKDIFAAQCFLLRKDFLDKTGWFDEEFLFYGQDSEWAHRVMRKGYPIYLRHDVLVDHIGHYSSKKAARRAEYNRTIEREYAQKLFEEKTKSGISVK